MNKAYHIIVADDDEDDQFIIKQAIREVTHNQVKITSVWDGQQLLDCLNKRGTFSRHGFIPDLIILDINMPRLNGMQVLEQLKNDKKLRHVPVYVLSTLRTIERVDKSLSLGAANYYSKPNQLGEYRGIVREILDNSIYAGELMEAE